MASQVSRKATVKKPASAASSKKTSQPECSGKVTGSRKKESRTIDGDTRRHIMLLLLKEGPITASYLGKQLGLTAAGVRRHLDNLVEDGLTEVVNRRPVGSTNSRGRPAKHFRLTDEGRAQFGHAYDELAADALVALRSVGGSEAVKQFAKARFERKLQGIDAAVSIEGNQDVEQAARMLANALDDLGYAATVTNAGSGVQICQHHCPVAHVAAANPELCEAEQEVFSTLLKRHVQPLASIADGHGICTTNIPLTIQPVENLKKDPNGKKMTGLTKGARRDKGSTKASDV